MIRAICAQRLASKHLITVNKLRTACRPDICWSGPGVHPVTFKLLNSSIANIRSSFKKKIVPSIVGLTMTPTRFDSYTCGSDKDCVGPVERVGAEGYSRLSPFTNVELVGLPFYSLRVPDMLDLLLVKILESRPGRSQNGMSDCIGAAKRLQKEALFNQNC